MFWGVIRTITIIVMLLFSAISAAAETGTLMGDTVTVDPLHMGLRFDVTVEEGVELPSIVTNGPTPRFSLDISENTITLVTIAVSAGYGGNYEITIGGLDPQISSCPNRGRISDIELISAGAIQSPENLRAVGNSRFTDDSVIIRLGPGASDPTKPSISNTWVEGETVSFRLTFDCKNTPPTAQSDSVSMDANGVMTFQPLLNDSDPDGDALKVTAVSSQNSALTVRRVSDTFIEISSPDASGAYAVDYQVSDGKGPAVTGRVNVTVIKNPTLRAVADDFTLAGTGSQIIQPLSNDVKGEGEAKILRVFNISPHLTVKRLSDTQINITPGTKAGSHSFDYEIGSGVARSSARVIVRVPNTPPVAVDDLLTLEPNTRHVFDPLSNDSDINGDELLVTSIGPVDAGLTAILDETKRIIIQTGNVSGKLSLTYTIADGQNTHSAKVIINIREGGTPVIPKWMIVGGLLLLAVPIIFLALRKLLFGRSRTLSPTPAASIGKWAVKPEKPQESGVVFANSPLLAGAVAPGPTPLVPAGHMAPSGLQTLTGQYSILKPAYLATGRIGGPQQGVPTNEDVSFGTGFLITPNHVMTNRHVFEFYKHYLTGPDCGGIEFIAERDRDASDYVAFNGEPPVFISGLDIAIFKLSRSVTDRPARSRWMRRFYQSLKRIRYLPLNASAKVKFFAIQPILTRPTALMCPSTLVSTHRKSSALFAIMPPHWAVVPARLFLIWTGSY